MNKDIMKKAGFGFEMKLVEEKKCPLCGREIDMKDFKDKLSKKEYTISGICQKCQDDIFG